MQHRSSVLPALVGGLATAFLWLSCAGSASADATLYERLGGAASIQAIADELIESSRADPVSGHLFRKINRKRFRAKLAEQLCTLTNGPCHFDGDDMKTTHAGLGITEADFYRLVERLVVILDEHGIGTREKNELLAVLAPFKRDVVTR
ncbi:MAG: group 1 truncated hemoglobin [Betaproteobacteria bacterium]|nr:group 1 truncated hemoglobin [Betaproteobacteria bacterium]